MNAKSFLGGALLGGALVIGGLAWAHAERGDGDGHGMGMMSQMRDMMSRCSDMMERMEDGHAAAGAHGGDADSAARGTAPARSGHR